MRNPITIQRLIEKNEAALKKIPANTTLYQMTLDTIERLKVELAVEKIYASLT